MVKRCFDILLSSVGLFLSAPVWAFIALRIYLEDRGPIFFKQERVGKDGRIFQVYKFRSMKVEQNDSPVQAGENDQRITRFGKTLRATALDELPQLWNVLKGEMSFVGPRPLMMDEVEIHSSNQDAESIRSLFEKRCTARPGLTGVAQIYAPRDIPRRRKFRYDLFYIKNQSFFLDLKLIFLSFLITFMGRWESRRTKLKIRKREVRLSSRSMEV